MLVAHCGPHTVTSSVTTVVIHIRSFSSVDLVLVKLVNLHNKTLYVDYTTLYVDTICSVERPHGTVTRGRGVFLAGQSEHTPSKEG